MKRLKLNQKAVLIGSLLVTLFFVLSACDFGGGNNSSQSPNKSTPGAPANTGKGKTTPTATAAPGVQLGAQNCPTAVSTTTYWDPIVPTQANINKVTKVKCANMIGTATLQAVVLVQNQGASQNLDVYVYDKITDPHPKVLFKLQNLAKGDALVSNYNTLVTSEVDAASQINTGKTGNDLKPDLFREFKWSDSTATLVPVSFPGFFPVMTRFEAEAEQLNVNQGQNFWERDAKQSAINFTIKLFKWDANAQATINSGGGDKDRDAEVMVKNNAPGNASIKVTMSRLEGNTNGGIWIVTGVNSDGLSLSSPQSQDRVKSPLNVAGKGNAFEGIIGTVKVLDHLYNEIGNVQAKGTAGNGNTDFTASVTYNKTFKTGSEEGLVVIYSNSQADGSIAGAAIVKELLG